MGYFWWLQHLLICTSVSVEQCCGLRHVVCLLITLLRGSSFIVLPDLPRVWDEHDTTTDMRDSPAFRYTNGSYLVLLTYLLTIWYQMFLFPHNEGGGHIFLLGIQIPIFSTLLNPSEAGCQGGAKMSIRQKPKLRGLLPIFLSQPLTRPLLKLSAAAGFFPGPSRPSVPLFGFAN